MQPIAACFLGGRGDDPSVNGADDLFFHSFCVLQACFALAAPWRFFRPTWLMQESIENRNNLISGSQHGYFQNKSYHTDTLLFYKIKMYKAADRENRYFIYLEFITNFYKGT